MTKTFSLILLGLTVLSGPALADAQDIALKNSIFETVRGDVQVVQEGRNAAVESDRSETGFDRERNKRPLESGRVQN